MTICDNGLCIRVQSANIMFIRSTNQIVLNSFEQVFSARKVKKRACWHEPPKNNQWFKGHVIAHVSTLVQSEEEQAHISNILLDIRWPQRLCQWVCACLHLHLFASRILLTQMNYFFELNLWSASSSFCSASLLRREDKPFAQSTDHAPAIAASLCYRIYCLYIIAVLQLFWHVLTGFICSNMFKSTKNQRKSMNISFLMFSPELSSKFSHSSPCFLPFFGGPLNPRGTNGSGVLRWLHDMWQSCRDKATQRVVTSDIHHIYIYKGCRPCRRPR